MLALPRLHWFDNPILWLGVQLVTFLALEAVAQMLLPADHGVVVDVLVLLGLVAAVTIGANRTLHALRARQS